MFSILIYGLAVTSALSVESQPVVDAETAAFETAQPTNVANFRTEMTAAEARLHLELAYRALYGEAPANGCLASLLAQWALETGRGKKMWGYNFAGIKAGPGGKRLLTRESSGSTERTILQRFRTYRSAPEGARDYLETLALAFPLSFVEVQRGIAEAFARALADEGYFTGDSAQYRRAIVLLAKEYERGWAHTDGALDRH